MKLLAFDTSTEVMSIAVQNDAQVWTHTGAGGAHTSNTLIPAIQSLMHQADLQFAQLDAIAFGRGPGSFTGLRTACSVAQGLAFAANVRVLPIDTLMALAEEARYRLFTHSPTTTAEIIVCAALDARMSELYWASYAFDGALCRPLIRSCLVSPQEVHLTPASLLAGNVRPAYDAQLPGAALALPYLACLPSARAMLRLAPQLIGDGALVDAQDALPLYIRDKVAQTTAEREAVSLAPAAQANAL